uniref:Uncharacterized protein n=1 Tax=Myoviridae sp. ctshb19 TaxID=2825194 RepID=A0A8S5UGR2_9CAUD|nr:MAG TPA: hypothetical protein [Myoviridae sp. ctshb19]
MTLKGSPVSAGGAFVVSGALYMPTRTRTRIKAPAWLSGRGLTLHRPFDTFGTKSGAACPANRHSRN